MIIKSVRKSTFNLLGTIQACGLHWGILAHSCYSRGKKQLRANISQYNLMKVDKQSAIRQENKKSNTLLMTVSMKILTKNLERTNAIIEEF